MILFVMAFKRTSKKWIWH